MIDRCMLNVTDLQIIRRTDTGIGGDGSDAVTASGLSAHHAPGDRLVRDAQGRDVVVSDTIYFDGVDSNGVAIDVRAHDFVQWGDWQGTQTKQLEIMLVEPHHEPGKGAGIAGLSHVVLSIG